jgi:hypothetical protein
MNINNKCCDVEGSQIAMSFRRTTDARWTRTCQLPLVTDVAQQFNGNYGSLVKTPTNETRMNGRMDGDRRSASLGDG